MDRRSIKHIIGIGVAASLFLGTALIQDPSKMIWGLLLAIGVLMWSEHQYGER